MSCPRWVCQSGRRADFGAIHFRSFGHEQASGRRALRRSSRAQDHAGARHLPLLLRPRQPAVPSLCRVLGRQVGNRKGQRGKFCLQDHAAARHRRQDHRRREHAGGYLQGRCHASCTPKVQKSTPRRYWRQMHCAEGSGLEGFATAADGARASDWVWWQRKWPTDTWQQGRTVDVGPCIQVEARNWKAEKGTPDCWEPILVGVRVQAKCMPPSASISDARVCQITRLAVA